MAGIIDILEVEKERHALEEWMVIHLFQEGSFYRAYEVSAWLCHTYIHQFKVTHRHVKGVDSSIVFVGFPVSSLEKRMPDGCVVETAGEKHLMLRLPSVNTDTAGANDEFVAWKSRQPLVPSKDSGETEGGNHKSETKGGGRNSLFAIAQRVMSYSIETHSPIDCMLFLSEVKKDLAQIL